ncbi:uncharacterized protein LOC134236214 [Saccostrea cucullata]|uniref:uncharacterized protein LOC134236214 n=1 Tax=Saccostrea cuccullata TaxID=36930 RepID=UPI002ED1A1AB
MATALPNLQGDLTVCSICLEHFKSPRYLPCTHTFCERCLETHIKSSCSDSDGFQLGFLCPLCRIFVPAPGKVGEFSSNEWADKLPENQFIRSIAEKCAFLNSIPCTPCNLQGEEHTSGSWCKDCSEPMCENCFQSHLKFRPSRSHQKVSLDKISDLLPLTQQLENCEDHEGRKLELFCETHFKPCCVLCITKDHSCCMNLNSLEIVADKLMESKKVKRLQEDVNQLESILEKVIAEEKANMVDIDNVQDKFTEEVSVSKEAIIKNVERLEEKHLNEIANVSKDAKAKLQKSINSLEQQQCYLRHWKEATLKNLTSTDSSKSVFALSYAKLEQICKHLQKIGISKFEAEIQTTMHDDVKSLVNLTCLSKITANERQRPVNLNETVLKSQEIQMIYEFKIDGADFRGGCFLKNGELILADNRRKRLIKCKADGTVLKEVSLEHSPWDMELFGENHMHVTLDDANQILVMEIKTFTVERNFNLSFRCCGISKSGSTIALGSKDELQVLNKNYEPQRISSDLSSVYDVAMDAEENIIYSSYNQYIVRKQDKTGYVLFSYTHEKLQRPYGLTLDKFENIYVNGKDSNNIHILSPAGEQLRILEGVQQPQCIKFQVDGNKFFVGEEDGRVKIFEFI